jgi:hypothetical protein
MLADFYAAVEANLAGAPYEPSFARFVDAHHVTRVVEAVVASSRSGAWVSVEPRGGEGA